MKIKIDNYTFDKTAKTVKFSDYSTIRLDSILLITNVESNVIIYNFADPTKGGSVSGNILTLDYNTSSMADTDKLQIFYDDASANQLSFLSEATNTIKNFFYALLNHDLIDKTLNRIRTTTSVTDAVLSSGTCTTCTTVTTLSNLDGYQAKISAIGEDATAWALLCRNRIT